ncbi:hypothetical protein T261_07900 [Streptomyces lydicus]|nr:hypothetical protein T261_07900 [Streptomyces lydicus]
MPGDLTRERAEHFSTAKIRHDQKSPKKTSRHEFSHDQEHFQEFLAVKAEATGRKHEHVLRTNSPRLTRISHNRPIGGHPQTFE